MKHFCYLTSDAGRAPRAAQSFNSRDPLAFVVEYCTARYTRFVILDAKGRQVYESDFRDSLAAQAERLGDR